ncbi:MAG TPA: hypothetical protein VMF08_05555, partial [Candidatus Sulfotelmatobacter sp.]|nr:hypothetical protein [Candidatus Sulfotelmatobacter sp.]
MKQGQKQGGQRQSAVSFTALTFQRFNLKNASCAQILEPIASKIVVFCDICFGVNKFTFSEVIDTKPKT